MLEVVCWICKKTSLGKALEALGASKRVSGRDMLQFCLDVCISETMASMISLCSKCCSKLKTFYKFRLLALKSFNDLTQSNLNKEQRASEKSEIQCDYAELTSEVIKIEYEEMIKNENSSLEVKDETKSCKDSDDELLSKLRFSDDEQTADDIANISETCSTINERATPPKSAETSEGARNLCGARARDVERRRRARTQSKEALQCPHCRKTYSSQSNRSKHVRRVHKRSKLFCDVCHKYFRDLSQHERRVHKRDGVVHQCEVCGVRYSSRSSLAAHMQAHRQRNEYVCAQCGAEFKVKHTLWRHTRRVHDKEKSFLCDYCSKGFFSKYALTMHIRRHTGERQYTCSECDKRFCTSSSLAIHMKRHTNRKEFACQLCYLTFVTSGALKCHTLTHTKEKNYECRVCGVRFGRSDHRNRHERTAHKHAHRQTKKSASADR